MCGIAPDGTRVTPSTPSEENHPESSAIAAPMSALSLDSTDDASFRTRTNSGFSETSISDSESKGPDTPRTITNEPLDMVKVDETAFADATVHRTRELMA